MPDKDLSHKLLKAVLTWQGITAIMLTGVAWGYLFIHFDLIPDLVPFFGYWDDIVVLVIAFIAIRKAITTFSHKYGGSK